MHTYVPDGWTVAPTARADATASPASSAHTGCANPTCAAMPPPKNVLTRPFVRSKNWSGITTSSGGYSSLRLPTALAEKMRSTPSSLKPKTLARKLSSLGMRRCPTPCRDKKATRRPRKVPVTYGPLGSPNGVDSLISSRSVSSSMS